MAGNGLFRKAEEDLETFAGMRLPICLCLDISNSMNWDDKIDKLNKGIEEFYEELRRDEITKYTAEVAVVTFGGNLSTKQFVEVKKIRDFSRIDIQGSAPHLTAYGLTPIGEAVNLSLELLEKRKKQYKEYGTTYYRPWLVVMSDGHPEGHSPTELERAKASIHSYALEKKVVPISVAIGDVDQEARKTLRDLGNGVYISLNSGKFLEFFRWLHHSVSDSVGKDVDELMEGFMKKAKAWSDDDYLKKL